MVYGQPSLSIPGVGTLRPHHLEIRVRNRGTNRRSSTSLVWRLWLPHEKPVATSAYLLTHIPRVAELHRRHRRQILNTSKSANLLASQYSTVYYDWIV